MPSRRGWRAIFHAVGNGSPKLAAQERAGQQHRQHRAAMRHGNADIATESDQVTLRHCHRNAVQKPAADRRPNAVRGCMPNTVAFRSTVAGGAADRRPGQSSKNRESGGHDRDNEQDCVQLHRVAPTIPFDRVRKERRPNHPGEGLPARDQRQRGAAPAIEPARHVDIERGIDPRIAEQSHQGAVPNIETHCSPRCSTAASPIAAIIGAPNPTVQRTPIRSAIGPIASPPIAEPSHASAYDSAGTDRISPKLGCNRFQRDDG